jgi:hypothetical protein
MILRDAASGTPRRTTRPIASGITALEGHDLRQPCQVGQCAYGFLGHSVRTAAELRMLQFVRSASVRLGDQYDALVTALLCKYTSQVKLPPVGPLLRQTIFENEFVVQTKGFGVRMARTSAAIASDALLLSTVLPNLVRIAVKYAQSGRRILLDRCQIDAEARPSPALFLMMAAWVRATDASGLKSWTGLSSHAGSVQAGQRTFSRCHSSSRLPNQSFSHVVCDRHGAGAHLLRYGTWLCRRANAHHRQSSCGRNQRPHHLPCRLLCLWRPLRPAHRDDGAGVTIDVLFPPVRYCR